MSEAGTIDVWTRTDTVPNLGEGDLQIWKLDLGGPNSRALLALAFDSLTAEERQRATRMRAGSAPEEFIAGRGSLRRLLSLSLDCDPQSIGIIIGSHRKPALRPVRGGRTPQFNVSHSRGMVLVALSQSGSVGVDVEYIDPAVEIIDVARGAFHKDDLCRVESLHNPKEKLLAFYGCWTRREAVAKADGRGLTLPASGFSTGTNTDGERMVEIEGDDTVRSANHYASRYFVRNLQISARHLGGVAVSRPNIKPMLMDFSSVLPSSFMQRNMALSLPSYASKKNSKTDTIVSSLATNLSGD